MREVDRLVHCVHADSGSPTPSLWLGLMGYLIVEEGEVGCGLHRDVDRPRSILALRP